MFVATMLILSAIIVTVSVVIFKATDSSLLPPSQASAPANTDSITGYFVEAEMDPSSSPFTDV